MVKEDRRVERHMRKLRDSAEREIRNRVSENGKKRMQREDGRAEGKGSIYKCWKTAGYSAALP
jgi:hypothetical protein